MCWVRGGLAAWTLVAVASMVLAQGAGGLRVQVVDAGGSPLRGASVTLSHDSGNVAPLSATLIKPRVAAAKWNSSSSASKTTSNIRP